MVTTASAAIVIADVMFNVFVAVIVLPGRIICANATHCFRVCVCVCVCLCFDMCFGRAKGGTPSRGEIRETLVRESRRRAERRTRDDVRNGGTRLTACDSSKDPETTEISPYVFSMDKCLLLLLLLLLRLGRGRPSRDRARARARRGARTHAHQKQHGRGEG